jgi:hypothetical protein
MTFGWTVGPTQGVVYALEACRFSMYFMSLKLEFEYFLNVSTFIAPT